MIEETKEQRRYGFKYRRLIKCHDGRKKKIELDEIATIEKGCLANHEQEISLIHFKDKKLATTQMKMKMELEKENLRLEQMEEKEIMMMDESVLPPMQQEYIHQR